MTYKSERRVRLKHEKNASKIARRFFVMTAWMLFTEPCLGEFAVGFARTEITPKLQDDKPVWLAGYGWNRQATGIHDPLYCRAVVLQSKGKLIALASVDVVGLSYPFVLDVRKQLPVFDYVMVSSTHNHEGPDTIGLWGRSIFQSGVDREYLASLQRQIVNAIGQAKTRITPCIVRYGTATNDRLVRDSRLPIVKDSTLRCLQFVGIKDQKTKGILVQWNCHPEAMGPNNTLITADFPGATEAFLAQKYQCPIAYFSGSVGGLMAPPHSFLNDHGEELKEGTFAFATAYGKAVGRLAAAAIKDAQPIQLSPFQTYSKQIAIPVTNPFYRMARLIRVVQRPSILWTGDPEITNQSIQPNSDKSKIAISTEIGFLKLGELSIAAIPGEIYPELVYGQFQEPADPNVDYPSATLEKPIKDILPDKRFLLFGLANDEIGYVIPKRQWDRRPPYAYNRKDSQYGEINSCGEMVAPIIHQTLQNRVDEWMASQQPAVPLQVVSP